MSRMVSRSRPRDGQGGMRFSEIIVMGIVVALVVAGARYYFVVYRHSPGYALGEYLGAIKAGSVSRQYDLIDEDDKKDFPTEKDYERNARQARGYTERISSVVQTNEKIDPKKPNLATIDAAISIRKSGQEVYQTGTDVYNDHYKLRKNKDGEWKVWLRESTINMIKATPSPAGDSIGNG